MKESPTGYNQKRYGTYTLSDDGKVILKTKYYFIAHIALLIYLKLHKGREIILDCDNIICY